MQYNLRAEVKNNNGAASILTWRYIECNDKLEALRIAFGYACANSNEQYMGKPEPPYQTGSIKVWTVSDEELEQESIERCREKAEFELFCGGYDEV